VLEYQNHEAIVVPLRITRSFLTQHFLVLLSGLLLLCKCVIKGFEELDNSKAHSQGKFQGFDAIDILQAESRVVII
jgi:hypothetical protein